MDDILVEYRFGCSSGDLGENQRDGRLIPFPSGSILAGWRTWWRLVCWRKRNEWRQSGCLAIVKKRVGVVVDGNVVKAFVCVFFASLLSGD